MKKTFAELNAERIGITHQLKEPDQVPISFPISGHWICGYLGIKELQYHRDPKIMLNAQLTVRRRLYELTGVFPDYGGVSVVPSAFGCEIVWPDDDAPWVKPLIENPEDIHKIEVPDPFHDGLFPAYLACFRYMQGRVGEEIVDISHEDGPFDTAALIRGIPEFMADLVLRTKMAHELLKTTTTALIEHYKVRDDVSNDLMDTIEIGDDLVAYLSPRHFKEFAIPYIRKFFESFPGKYKKWHCDGQISKNLDLIPELGAHAWTFFDAEIDIGEVKKRIGDKMCLYGNIHPRKILLRVTPQEVEEKCKEQIMKAALGGGYVLCSGGEVPKYTPIENLLAMIEATEKYGKYPISLIR